MKIVQTVEEVPHVTPEYWKHAIVAVLTDESYKVHAHLVEELFFRHTEHLMKRAHLYVNDYYWGGGGKDHLKVPEDTLKYSLKRVRII